MKSTDPRPIGPRFDRTCFACSCSWTIDTVGEPNKVSEWCESASCLCHGEWFSEGFLAGLAELRGAA